MEEIDLTQLISYFKSKWFYVLFAVSLFFCVASIYVNQIRTLEYTSYTKIILNQASSEAINSNDINLNQSLVPDYTEIIKSKLVLNQVIDILDLDLEYDELVRMINVSGVNDTAVIKISVTNKDSNLACDIATTIANIFMKEIVEIYKLDNVSVLDEAEVSLKSSSTSAFKIIIVAMLAGAVISCGIIFVFFYFDTTIKSEDVIESATGIPVIGVVPFDGNVKKTKTEDIKYDTESEISVEKVKETKTKISKDSEYKVVRRRTRKTENSEV